MADVGFEVERRERELKGELAATVKAANEAKDQAEAAHKENAKLRAEIERLKIAMTACITADRFSSQQLSALPERHRGCRNVIAEYADWCEIGSWPAFEPDGLRVILTQKDLNGNASGSENGSGSAVGCDRWSSDPQIKAFSTITIEMKGGLMVALDCYRLKSGFLNSDHWPFLRNWEVYG
jgi:hypothetical protein